MNLFFYYFLLFFIYSVLGWLVETTYVNIQEGKLVNRGFLIGPYCPIYGFGCLAMTFYLSQYKSNIFTVFILGTVICCCLEYFTSYIMEVIFKARWWDYSNEKFNLNGRICGLNALLFGVGGVIIVYIIHPLFSYFLNTIDYNILRIISILLFILFLSDTIISFNIINRFKKTITSIELKKDSTHEISKMVQDILKKKHHIFQTRLASAFPNIDFRKLVKIKTGIKEEIKELLKK